MGRSELTVKRVSQRDDLSDADCQQNETISLRLNVSISMLKSCPVTKDLMFAKFLASFELGG